MAHVERLRRAGGRLGRFGSALVRDVRSIPNVWATILLGGLLWGHAVSLVVLSFLVMGFFVRVLRYIPPSTTSEDVTPRPSDPPQFDRWLALLLDGVRAYVIWTAYVLIAFSGYIALFDSDGGGALLLAIFNSLLGNVSFLLELYASLNGGFALPDPVTWASLVDPTILGLLFALYVGPAALLNFAARGTIADGFSFSDLGPILRSPTYARNWVVFVLAWGTGSFTLLSPSHLIASYFVPMDVPTLVEAVRESIELFRGFVSFAIFLLGYTALGRVPVPPSDKFSIGEYLRSRLDSDAVTLVGRSVRSGQTLLVATLLAAFWSVPAITLLMGYVARLVRVNGSSADPTIPSFGSLRTLVADGVRTVGLWAVFGVPPLVFLFIWNSRNPWPNPVVGNVLTGLPAFVVGAWYLGRDVYMLMIDVWPSWFSRTPIHPQVALVAFTVLSLLATYLYPAAVVLVGRSRDIRSGLSPRRLVDSAGTAAYAGAWLHAMASFTLGTALLLAWNAWRERPERQLVADATPLFRVGDFPLISVPTDVGIQSSFLLLLVGAGNVLLLLWAYFVVAVAIPDSEDTRTRTS